jgi:F-type H+-transporting ATPase subunit gamma
MRVIAASKLKKDRAKMTYSGSILSEVGHILNEVVKYNQENDKRHAMNHLFFNEESGKKNEAEPNLIVLFSSEKGLCGAFNSSVIKKFKSETKNLKNYKVIIVGKKGYENLKSSYPEKIYKYYPSINAENNALVSELASDIINFQGLEKCVFIYSSFKSSILQVASSMDIFDVSKYSHNSTKMHDFEGENLFKSAIDTYLKYIIRSVLSESKISEETLRMIAMDSSTKNAKKIIDRLTIEYNRKRQNIITKEIIEIISGSEAIGGN